MSKRSRGVRLTSQTLRSLTSQTSPKQGRLRHVGFATRLLGALGALGALAWFAGCEDAIRVAGPESDGLTAAIPQTDSTPALSDPISNVSSSSSLFSFLAASGATVATDVAYLSLAPGTVPDGERVRVHRRGSSATITAAMDAGGFDPLSVTAAPGDTLDVEVLASGALLRRFALEVPAARRPRVVRTYPPRKKRDVALNSSIMIVFTEPVAPATLTPLSVQVFRGASAVAGTVSLLGGTATSVVFTPGAPLQANTTYRLEVTQAVTDLEGDALAAGETVEFTTGQSSVGPPASIRLAPDSVLNLPVGSTYPISVSVLDSDNNILTTQRVAWTSSNPVVATVTPADSNGLARGRVRGVGAGSATIIASSGTLSATATVTVSAPVPNGVTSVTIAPDSLTLPALDGRRLVVTLRNANGNLPGPGRLVITFASSNPAVLSAPGPRRSDYCGMGSGGAYMECFEWNHVWIQPVAEGSTVLIATSEGVSDTAVITVGPRRAIASMTVTPAFQRVVVQDSATLLATLRDATGVEITGLNGGLRDVSWTSDNPAVATVDTGRGSYPSGNETAMVTTVGVGVTTVTASAEGLSSTATIAVQGLITFASVSAGDLQDYSESFVVDNPPSHSCGVATGGAAYCWGSNDDGELGDGTYWPSRLPAAVSGGLTFSMVGAGTTYSCGLTTDGAAYCWGLGRNAPVAVSGEQRFVALSVSLDYACGLTAAGVAHCWRGTDVVSTASMDGFIAVSAGYHHTCYLTVAREAYCAGENDYGQIGDGSVGERWASVPLTAVAGGHRFIAIEAGFRLTCGLTATGAAYCWGYNGEGSLGDGTTTSRSLPVAVTGGHQFVSLTAGRAAANVCGLTAAGVAYCWGNNNTGQLGSVSGTVNPTPMAVAGGLRFSSVNAGGFHTCAVSTAAIAYCWGRNGNGYTLAPEKVAGQP
jgi:uncharacterized protein YjdB